MALLRKVADCMLQKGGMLGAGILGVLLWKRLSLPEYAGAISLCATSVGFCVTAWYIFEARDKKQESSTEKVKERLEQQYTADVTEDEHRKGYSLDGREQGSYEFADDGEISNERIKSSEYPKGESIVPSQVRSLKECFETCRKKQISEAHAGEVVVTNEHSVDSSEASILSDGVDEAVIRESALKELDPSSETVGLAEDVLKKGREAEDEYTGEVFQASELFKDWDNRHPNMQNELTAIVWRGKRALESQ